MRDAAGAMIIAADTGRALFALRSAHVKEPGTWGLWGGKIEAGETPRKAAVRELREETGYSGDFLNMRLLYTFQRGEFRYDNYLIVVPHEFKPRLNWETDAAAWLPPEDAPAPWHYGLRALFENTKAVELIEAARRSKRRLPNPVVDGPLYHVTFSGRLAGIAEDGLEPGSGRTFQSFAGYARGWVFLTDEDGLRGWFYKIHGIAEGESDDPVDEGWVPVVLRTTRDVEVEDDPEGNRDVSEGKSYRTREKIDADDLEVWTGHAWVPVDEWESLDPELGVTREIEDDETLVWLDDADASGLFPLWREDWGPRRGRHGSGG